MALNLEQSAVDTVMVTIGSKATYAGATGTALSWVFSSEFGIAVGVLIGVFGFALNWYYSRRRDQREQVALELLIQKHREDTHAK